MFKSLFFLFPLFLSSCNPQEELVEKEPCAAGTILMAENEKRTEESILILNRAQAFCSKEGSALNFILSERLAVPPTKSEIRKVGVFAILTDAAGNVLQEWREEVPLERPAFAFTHAQEFVIPSPFGSLSGPSHKVWYGLV